MEITIEQLNLLDKNSYIIYDTRSEIEKQHGEIENAVCVLESELLNTPMPNKKVIVCCARGQKSL